MYEPQQGKPMHAHTEEVARWCRSHGILTKGHPLAWNHADPSWLPGDPDEIHRLQMARIDDCVQRFRGLIDRWDVINEVTHYDRDEFAKHTAPKYTAMWKKYGQIDMPRECFLHARQANPQGVLVINDYRTDPAYERVIEQLVDEKGKRLYDVIGIQSHMHGGVWSNGQIWKVCQRFARFGVPLHFTETTILSGERGWDKAPGSPWPSTPEGEAFQAREAARFYTMLFSHPAVAAITWWDFSDLHAWKGAPAGLRAEGHDAQTGLRGAEEADQRKMVDPHADPKRRGRHRRGFAVSWAITGSRSARATKRPSWRALRWRKGKSTAGS